ncbi:extracellular solute-binding protein [Cohnella sp. CFH 77786]|uniref:extracellular solute-binding protein n=1 Tax=Cohnella sp. CFH 77786 TaxID=2662265 RepID=UPI001C60A85B|nr:extracellular solute-binding protein [Cohnella sp. CFH 77786]MBW5446836.1 extracellular solute-binding protein [Cohnella sp. CFH 77786]
MIKRRWKSGALAVMLLAALLTACSPTGGKKEQAFGKLDKDEEGTLKVAYFDEQAFLMQVGNAFQAMFPNMQLEVIPTQAVFDADDPVTAMEKLLEEQQPDVLYLTEEQYAKLAQGGKLYDLDAAVKQDEYDLSAFVPGVIDLLKARGGGKLYGLSPTFNSQALYYNKDLFDKYGVPYPTDGMSWDEVLELAARFPVKKDDEDSISGLFPSSQIDNAFELIRMIGEAKGLQYADTDSGKVSIDTPEWKAVFQQVIDGYKSGSIFMPGSGEDGGSGGGPRMSIRGAGGGKVFMMGPNAMRFMAGQAAMTIDGPMVMGMLGETAGGGIRVTAKAPAGGGGPGKDPAPMQAFNWDMVTLPVDPSQPDVAGGYSVDGVLAINASSPNLAAAWELLKYTNGEQLAKAGSKSMGSLSSRTAYKKEAEGKNTAAFYALGANSQTLLQSLPSEFVASFASLVSEHVKKTVDGTEMLEAALQAIQSQGQDLLTKAGLETDQP